MADVLIQRDQGTGTHRGTLCEDVGEDGVCQQGLGGAGHSLDHELPVCKVVRE